MVEQVNQNTEDIRRLEYWRDGNGALGAEQRLQAVEALISHVDAQAQEGVRLIKEHRAWHKEVTKKAWWVIGILVADMLIPVAMRVLEAG